MVYFGIKTEFEAFQGEVIDFQENLNGVSLPHQVIKNGHGKILLAKKVTGRTSGDDIGKTMKVEPSRNGSYDRLIVFPVMEEEFLGQVRAVKTFSLGRNAFFVDLDIYQDEERFVHIAFRPWPSQKRTMGMELCGKTVCVTSSELFIVNKNGEKKLWPK